MKKEIRQHETYSYMGLFPCKDRREADERALAFVRDNNKKEVPAIGTVLCTDDGRYYVDLRSIYTTRS